MSGHGGGAWKVAYADFVTAMMALFMVLWISSQDKKILIATSRYFQSPFHSPLEDHSGIMPFNKQANDSSSASSKDPQQQKAAGQTKQIDISFLNSVAADFYRLVHIDQDLQEKPIDVAVTSDGLRVTLFDRARCPLFDENGATLTPWGKFVMQNLAWLIDRHHFHVMIAGHTRAGLKLTKPNYSDWELSTDRANSARRCLVRFAVDPDMIERISGYGDTRPVPGQPPTAESNQRITLSLSLDPPTPLNPAAAAPAATTASD
jgi:chemotaxis protein MotB